MTEYRKFRVLAGSHRDRGRGGFFTDGKIRSFKKGQIYAHEADLCVAFPEKFEEVAADAPVSYVKPQIVRGKKEDDPVPAPAPEPAKIETEKAAPVPEIEDDLSEVEDDDPEDEDEDDDEDEEEEEKPAKKPKVTKKAKK